MTDRSLKVLMIAPTPFFSDRGCHVRIYEEARALQQLGVKVCIVTYGLGRDMPGLPIYRIIKLPWYTKVAAGPSVHKPYLDILLLIKALSISKDFAADIIHGHLHEGALIGYFLKKLMKVPMIFDYQGSMTSEISDHGLLKKGSLPYRGLSALEHMINNSADFIITSSTAGAGRLVTDWGVPTTNVTAVIDGVDTNSFRPGDKTSCRAYLGLPLDTPVVGFLGLLNSYQGVDLLLDSMAILQKHQLQVHFLVMGFPEKAYIEKARKMGLASMVTFTGRIDYRLAPRYLSACDLAVSPKISLTEANGKLFNYMACGLPTIVFDTVINREILGDTGIYARYSDVEDLAAKIEIMVLQLAERERFSELVRVKAEREHSWSVRGKEILRIYRQLLSRP